LKTGILYLTINTVISVILYCFEMITDDWKKRHLAGIICLTLFGAVIAVFYSLHGVTPPDVMWTIVYAMFAMIVLLTAYLAVFRFDFRMLSLSLFMVMTGAAVNLAVIHPYPNSLKGAVLAVMIMFGNLLIILSHERVAPTLTGTDTNGKK